MSVVERALQEARDAGADPLRAAALARAVSAVTALTRGQDEVTLGEAVAAPSNVAVLYRMLSTPEAVDILRSDDPLIEAQLRGIAARDDILKAEGGTVDVETAAHILGISRQAVDRRRQRYTISHLAHEFARYYDGKIDPYRDWYRSERWANSARSPITSGPSRGRTSTRSARSAARATRTAARRCSSPRALEPKHGRRSPRSSTSSNSSRTSRSSSIPRGIDRCRWRRSRSRCSETTTSTRRRPA